MAKVKLVNKQVRMDLDEIIKFQLITHCYINHIAMSDLDFECLINLGKIGEYELTDFCTLMAEKRHEEKLKTWKSEKHGAKKPNVSPQTIRNVLIKVEKDNLLIKTGAGRKKITLNPDLKIQLDGNILLNIKLVHIEPQKTE